MIEDALLDEELRPIDRLGRRQPRRMNVLVFCQAIPGFASQLQRCVPESFYTAGKKGIVEVKCPCGAVQTFELGSLDGCTNCDRVYLWTGKSLRVGNSPSRQEVVATAT